MHSPLRLGVLGLTHDHVWGNLADAGRNPATRIVAAADPNQELLGRFEREFFGRPYRTADTMLDSEQLDAVYVFADNAACPELTESAAGRGLHVLVEKPMAASAKGADRMLRATSEANVRLMVNWPFAWWPQMQQALRMAGDGSLGRVWQVRYRAAHAGPRELGCSEYFCDWLFDPRRNGPGGAYIDYCCYGAVLARAILGMPDSVTAIAGRFVKTDIDVDDNAVLLMNYADAMAVSEGSWSQIGKLSAYVTLIYGTTGTLMLEPRAGGRLLLATAEHPEGVEVNVPGPAEVNRDATAHFVHCVHSAESPLPLCDPRICRDAQVILDAGARSISSRRQEALE